jgi:phage terminase large subunit-like protein
VTDYVASARAYEAAVVGGEILACKWVRLACDRNVRDRARVGADPNFPYRFDDDAAVRICRAAEKFPHIKGPKAKVVGRDSEGRNRWATIELEPWQCWLLTTLFGWVHALTGLRRFKVGLILVPRKNAKSTLGAVVANVLLAADGESGAEVYSAATTREQAKAVAETAWEMAKRSPEFREYFGVRLGAKTTRSLEVPATASKFAPLSADAHTLDGLNVSGAIVDELHAHKTRDVWDVLDTATGARDQSLLLAITTAGVDIGGICYEKLTYLHKVLEQALEDDEFFGIEYTIDEGDDWRTEAAWRKANPNYGVSVRPDDLRRKAREAAHSPGAINNFLTKHCNVWVRAESTWMPMPEWVRCGDASLRLEDFVSYPCWIGVDLAEVRDFAAIVALFRTDPKRYVVFGKFFLPETTLERSPIAQMSGWAAEGHIIATDGDQADYQLIEDEIVNWCDLFEDVREIDFDRALASRMAPNLKTRLMPRMGKDGVERFVITVPQTVETMNPAMQLIESLTLAGDIRHPANPAFNWMFSNVVVERNYKDEIFPRKAGGKDSPHKIDGPVATFTAASRASQIVLGRPRRRSRVSRWTPDGFVPVGAEASPSDTPPLPGDPA